MFIKWINKKRRIYWYNYFQNYIYAVYSIRTNDLNENIQLLNYEIIEDYSDNTFLKENIPNRDEIEKSCIMFFIKKS